MSTFIKYFASALFVFGGATIARADDSAEADELVAELMGESSQAVAEEDPSVNIHGFADFGVSKMFVKKDELWSRIFDNNTSFAVGNLNLYLDADLTSDFKSLIEIRFMFLPSGTQDPNKPGFLDPSVDSRYAGAADPIDVGRLVKWGAIEIERVYVEYTFHSLLRARAGRFLTPWGIWNVDHGSPVIIDTARPYIIGEGFFPEAQTGIEVFGNLPLGDMTAGYHVTLSNGRGPIEQYGDLDSNKALGARLWLNARWFGDLTLGLSGYAGTYSDVRQQIDLMEASPIPQGFMFERYRERSLAADLRFEYSNISIQSEVALHDRVWSDGARPIDRNGSSQADNRRLGAYVMAAYRLPWFNLRPFAMTEYYNSGTSTYLAGARDVMAAGGGLNARVAPNVVAKLSYHHVWFFNAQPGTIGEGSLRFIGAQLSWAF